MKKIVFVLVVLLFTAPAWANVFIDANQVGDTNQVEISYEVTAPDVNLPRAFGLNITVSDGNIVACEPNMVGECTASVRGFGIFPGTTLIDANGTVTYDGTPVAPAGVGGALGGIDTNGITIEMGSLYQDGNEPPFPRGVLCTITVTESCTVTIEGNAARCGTGSPAMGVVMENPDEVPDVNYVSGEVMLCGTCPLDITSWEPGVPDGYITADDLLYMLAVINECEWQWCDVADLPDAEKCLDVTSWEPGVPDGYVTADDLLYLLAIINECEWQWCDCP